MTRSLSGLQRRLQHAERSERARVSAVIVAAIGDPGLGALREALARRPVTGLSEAALMGARLLGQRFS